MEEEINGSESKDVSRESGGVESPGLQDLTPGSDAGLCG